MDANAFLSTGHIALWLLVVGLFLPRLALFIAWVGTGDYPNNTLPDLLNLAMWILFPRFLMAFYIFTDMGANNIWFWAYIATGIAGTFGETSYAHRRVIHRTTTTTPDGSTTTTVKEEEVE